MIRKELEALFAEYLDQFGDEMREEHGFPAYIERGSKRLKAHMRMIEKTPESAERRGAGYRGLRRFPECALKPDENCGHMDWTGMRENGSGSEVFSFYQ